jgi:hypothetical protein
MKTLITALAVTAILATPAAAKTQRTKEARIQPNSVSYNSVNRSSGTQLNHNSPAKPPALPERIEAVLQLRE